MPVNEHAPSSATLSPSLADTLAELTTELIAGVEQALSSTVKAVPRRRTLARLPALLRDLVERLRAGRFDDSQHSTAPPIEFDVLPLVTALQWLERAIYAHIDERQLHVTLDDEQIIIDWFAAATESALAAENRRFAALLDAIPARLMLHDREARLIYVNKASADVVRWAGGPPGEDVLGRRLIDFDPDNEFGRMIYDDVRRVVAGEHIAEELLLPQPGGARWGERFVVPVHGSDGNIELIATDSRDIHVRKKAEARLDFMAKLGTLAETTGYESVIDAVARLSVPELADCCIVHMVADGQARRGPIAHRDPTKRAIVDELSRIEPQLHTIPAGKRALAGEALLVDDFDAEIEAADPAFIDLARRLGLRSALIVPFLVMGVPVALAAFAMTPESGRRYTTDDLAAAEEIAGRSTQIMENIQLRKDLQRSEALFRLALDHTNISVFETDRDLHFTWRYNALLGQPEERAGQTLIDALGPNAAAELAQLKRVVVDGTGMNGAMSATIDGKKRHFMIRYDPLRAIGGIVGLIGASVDVTEAKEAEEQIARELAFRERMMGILGHDLRNPVSAVLGITGLMSLNAGLGDKSREQLALIAQSARRMNEMIGTLLDFTRVRFSGSLPVALVDLDLHELARGVVAELEAAHRGREIELSIVGNVSGRADPGRIAQLLTNLVRNALSHGAHESPVWVDLAGEGDVITLRVSNRGPTIPASAVERLFEPFQQGSEADVRKRGLGLGLFIARQIVAAHQGTIAVRSTETLTTFVVSLPRATSVSAEEQDLPR